MPQENEIGNLNLLASFNPKNIPIIVENSASPFITEPTTAPLRASIAREAMAEVKVPGMKPKSSRDKTMGTPVKSNFRKGSHGKGIFNPEYFSV